MPKAKQKRSQPSQRRVTRSTPTESAQPMLPPPPQLPQEDFHPGLDNLADIIFQKVMAKVSAHFEEAPRPPTQASADNVPSSLAVPSCSHHYEEPSRVGHVDSPASVPSTTTGVVATTGVAPTAPSVDAANLAVRQLLGESVVPHDKTPLPLSCHLGIHVPVRLRERIWAGQFLELAILLPENTPTDEEESDSNKKQTKKLPPLSFEDFQSAFHIYVAIRSSKFPADAAGMLKHMQTVHELHKSFVPEAWAHYDRHYRMAMHHNQQV